MNSNTSRQGTAGRLVRIRVGPTSVEDAERESAVVEGNLGIPKDAEGIVLFAHGTGSSRHSPSNQRVADALRAGGFATLLMDLLTPEEKRVDARTRRIRFDIERLAERVVRAVDWLKDQPETRDLPLGGFGSSTGAAAVLIAAEARPGAIRAVVSRAGRVDMAEPILDRVRAPILSVVGSRDCEVLELNRAALSEIRVESKLAVVKGAGYLFETPGDLDEVAGLTLEWFARYLASE